MERRGRWKKGGIYAEGRLRKGGREELPGTHPVGRSSSSSAHSLVRPHLEYASTVWDPHTQKNIHKLDMVQRRAARYTCNRYHNISSVTEMVGHLGWEPLATRRRNMRLCMMYKIAHTVVGDPWTEWLTISKRVTRGFHAWKYIPIYSHHNIYKFSFLPRTIIDWNSLSPHSVDSPSIDTFRARITRN